MDALSFALLRHVNVFAFDIEWTFRPCDFRTGSPAIAIDKEVIEPCEVRKGLSVNRILPLEHISGRHRKTHISVTHCFGERLEVAQRLTENAPGVGASGRSNTLDFAVLSVKAKYTSRVFE